MTSGDLHLNIDSIEKFSFEDYLLFFRRNYVLLNNDGNNLFIKLMFNFIFSDFLINYCKSLINLNWRIYKKKLFILPISNNYLDFKMIR